MGSRRRQQARETITKIELRDAMRQIRTAMSNAERQSKSAAATTRLRALLTPEKQITTIAIFAAIRNEIDIGDLLETPTKGSVLAFPRVVPTQQQLTFHRVRSRTELMPSTFGIPEPSSRAPQLLPGSLDAIVVPGLAFDLDGNRLGWGGGYYDKALRRRPSALRVGVAFSNQLVASVPVVPTDIPVDYIVTENSLIRCPGADRPGRSDLLWRIDTA